MDKIYIEITNVCNLRCSFCPPTARDPEFLPAEKFGILLGRLRGATKVLYFHVKGEPLLHPAVGPFIEAAGRAGFAVRLTTNGTLLPDRMPELVGKAALERVNVSIHSLEGPPNHGLRESLNRMLDAVSELRASDPERLTLKTISLRLWNRTGEDEEDPLIPGLEGYFGLADGTLSRMLSGQRGAVLRPGISVHPAERFEWPSVPAADKGSSGDGSARGFCRGLRDQAGILVDGTVVPCCLDGEGTIALGNIYESDWESIIRSPRAQAIYDGFSRREAVEPLCRRCGYRERF